jgi:NAD(P)-dependent dehydrogenase (short-subunit alcohol dehydrogenase family)
LTVYFGYATVRGASVTVDQFHVDGQTAVVTGASSGIGRDSADGRHDTNEEIADVAQFLASPAASYPVGQTITSAGVPDIMEDPEI